MIKKHITMNGGLKSFRLLSLTPSDANKQKATSAIGAGGFLACYQTVDGNQPSQRT
jgi:hypothetical protein